MPGQLLALPPRPLRGQPGRSVIGGDEQLAFLGILLLALLFEAGWYRARGTNAVVGLQSPR